MKNSKKRTVPIERVVRGNEVIYVLSPESTVWYSVTTTRATSLDFAWMLRNKPTSFVFEVNDSNYEDFRTLATASK